MMTELRFLTAGESHGQCEIVILEGLPAGLSLSPDIIDKDLQRRKQGIGSGSRMNIEMDQSRILSGVMNGETIGSPLAVMIDNKDHQNWQGKLVESRTVPRPGHTDLAAAVKYGYSDLRPGFERSSARETVVRVAVGAVCRHFLSQFGVSVGGYVRSIGPVTANVSEISERDRVSLALLSDVCCPDKEAAAAMRQIIQQAMQNGETLGGVIEVFGFGFPVGCGSHVHWDRKLDGLLAQAVMSIPAIKGVELGSAYENASKLGTDVQDSIHISGEQLIRNKNASGGVEGGISNGETIIVRAAMKPIPTTVKPQSSVDLVLGKNVDTVYERSDICPVPRGVVIVEAMTAFILAKTLLERLGGDEMTVLKDRFSQLRRLRVPDLEVTSEPKVWWP
jgi:chorismate synthase